MLSSSWRSHILNKEIARTVTINCAGGFLITAFQLDSR
jgi:hypothetical protein